MAKLCDILSKKKKGDEWYTFEFPEEMHVWTLKNKWKPDSFTRYNINPSTISLSGAIETVRDVLKINKKVPLFLNSGSEIKRGRIETTTRTNASIGPIYFDSAIELNQILIELSHKTGIASWKVQNTSVFNKSGDMINFQIHNPNGKGASLYFYRIINDLGSRLYPDVSLNEQQNLFSMMNLNMAHCFTEEKIQKVHGCLTEHQEKVRAGKKIKWITVKAGDGIVRQDNKISD